MKLSAAETEALNLQTRWTPRQRNHLRRLIRSGAEIAYVVTDRHGRPSNGGTNSWEWQVRPGLVQRISGPLEICTPAALHGTTEPHRWRGERVWVAGFVGEVQRESDKLGSLHREIVGEVYPECALSDSVGVRIGRKNLAVSNLAYAHLAYAHLACANLERANLAYANLLSANLLSAHLAYAHLAYAKFVSANLESANLLSANLESANLAYAHLVGANLACANLERANLKRANLAYANLERANLERANLESAHLAYANFEYANLERTNLAGAYCPNPGKEITDRGYEANADGYLQLKSGVPRARKTEWPWKLSF